MNDPEEKKMKKFLFIFAALMLFPAFTPVSAQDKVPPANDFVERDALPDDQPERRGQIIARELGLTPEQRMQIQQINRQRGPLLRDAQQRLQLARQELDEMIYADDLDEATLQAKVREVAEAQVEITRIKAMSEVAIRNVLTPEQLVKFRDLRARFKEQQMERRRQQRQRMQNRRQMNRRDRNPGPSPLRNRN